MHSCCRRCSAQTISTRLIRVFTTIVVMLGIASVLVVSVVQKRKEIGILRAMGATRAQMTRVFLLQGAMVGWVGLGASASRSHGACSGPSRPSRKGSDGQPLFVIALPLDLALAWPPGRHGGAACWRRWRRRGARRASTRRRRSACERAGPRRLPPATRMAGRPAARADRLVPRHPPPDALGPRPASCTNGQPLIELAGVRKTYGLGTPMETEVLHGIDLALTRGEFVALIGPSGSGKSTLLNIIGLLEPLTCGRVPAARARWRASATPS